MLNEETKEFIRDLLSVGKIGSKEIAMLKDELSDNGTDITQCFDEIEKTAVDYLTEQGKDVQKFKVFWHAEKYKMQNGIADIPNGTDYDDEFEELLNAVIIDNKADAIEMAYLAKECAKRNIAIDTIGSILEKRIAERSPEKVKRFQLSWRVRCDELGLNDSAASQPTENVAPVTTSSPVQEPPADNAAQNAVSVTDSTDDDFRRNRGQTQHSEKQQKSKDNQKEKKDKNGKKKFHQTCLGRIVIGIVVVFVLLLLLGKCAESTNTTGTNNTSTANNTSSASKEKYLCGFEIKGDIVVFYFDESVYSGQILDPVYSVTLAGQFQNWDPTDSNWHMKKISKTVWSIEVPRRNAPCGSQFKFVINDIDWMQPDTSMDPKYLTDDGVGGFNLVLACE